MELLGLCPYHLMGIFVYEYGKIKNERNWRYPDSSVVGAASAAMSYQGDPMPSKDLRKIMEGWPYEPGQVSVRVIRGEDSRPKIQMRVDLGILQMEVDGRPDGQKPHNYDSLLDYQKKRREKYHTANGSDLGFMLDPDECRDLRDEAYQYYQRYLANFVLEDYKAVARDTMHNLETLEFCVTFAAEDDDRYAMEVYRPYLLMMHSQSLALVAMKRRSYREALRHVESGLRAIRTFFKQTHQSKAYRISAEARILKALRRDIKSHLPVDRAQQLRKKLSRAIQNERYEEAAQLRDELNAYLQRRPRTAE